jgi:hypothetical protein
LKVGLGTPFAFVGIVAGILPLFLDFVVGMPYALTQAIVALILFPGYYWLLSNTTVRVIREGSSRPHNNVAR